MAILRRPPRDFQALERRRTLAARLFASGETVLASVARQVKASRQSVCRWYAVWKKRGKAGLKSTGRAGRRPQLNARQLRRVERALLQGARAHGFSADLWSLPRVALVIERITGVKYHPGHVWRILGGMDWSPQKPAQQAKERDDQKVAYWRAVRWPELKKTLRAAKPGSSSKTNRALRNNPPSVGRGRHGARPLS